MYVLRTPDREQPPREYGELEAKARGASTDIWSSELLPRQAGDKRTGLVPEEIAGVWRAIHALSIATRMVC